MKIDPVDGNHFGFPKPCPDDMHLWDDNDIATWLVLNGYEDNPEAALCEENSEDAFERTLKVVKMKDYRFIFND
jgi:hypothetical protein